MAMHPQTIKKSDKLINNRQVELKTKDSIWPSYLVFLISAEHGGKYNVIRRVDRHGNYIWACNSINKNKTWGCVMDRSHQHTPRCSHVLAAEKYLHKITNGKGGE